MNVTIVVHNQKALYLVSVPEPNDKNGSRQHWKEKVAQLYSEVMDGMFYVHYADEMDSREWLKYGETDPTLTPEQRQAIGADPNHDGLD